LEILADPTTAFIARLAATVNRRWRLGRVAARLRRGVFDDGIPSCFESIAKAALRLRTRRWRGGSVRLFNFGHV
jgi:hypothetical protein